MGCCEISSTFVGAFGQNTVDGAPQNGLDARQELLLVAARSLHACRLGTRLGGIVAVEEDGGYHEGGAEAELQRQVEVEDVDGGHARYDDGQRGGESLQDVVRILDHHGDDESSARLQEHQIPDEHIVAVEEAPVVDPSRVVHEAGEQPKGNAQQAELDIPHPHRDLGTLQDLLEVDAREAGQEAGSEGGPQSQHSVLFGGTCRRSRCSGTGRGGARTATATARAIRLGQLDEDNAHHEEQQSTPLGVEELPAKDHHREHGRGEDLQLVGHLVGGGVQVRGGDVQQVVLDDVDERGDAHLESVHRIGDDRPVQRADELLGVLALLVEDQEQAGDQLGELGHQHGWKVRP